MLTLNMSPFRKRKCRRN